MRYRAPGVPLRIYYYSIIPLAWDGKVQEVLLLMDDQRVPSRGRPCFKERGWSS